VRHDINDSYGPLQDTRPQVQELAAGQHQTRDEVRADASTARRGRYGQPARKLTGRWCDRPFTSACTGRRWTAACWLCTSNG